jgi:hypothetical protein
MRSLALLKILMSDNELTRGEEGKENSSRVEDDETMARLLKERNRH